MPKSQLNRFSAALHAFVHLLTSLVVITGEASNLTRSANSAVMHARTDQTEAMILDRAIAARTKNIA